MFHRIINLSNHKSSFIFGARGVGKSTFIRNQWQQKHHYINLLLDRWERRYQKDPDLLLADINGLKIKPHWVVIDEIQKVPKLLDIVQEIIESTNIRFLMTGSSARKLKRSSSNLLAGRAFHYQMFPLTYRELAQTFDLDFILSWGSLPSIFKLNEKDRAEYLRSYCQTYLKEEILQEQLVRNGIAFRSFLEVAAQESGKTINFSKVAKDVGIDTKTAQSFFQILEDTLVGYLIPAYTKSARKSVKLQPKFYVFDLGIKRAMGLDLSSALVPRTGAYGTAFEHFIILETIRLNHYQRTDFQISHYNTTAGGEVDLILHRSKEVIAIEIKSSSMIDRTEVTKLARISEPLKPTKIIYVSQDPNPSMISGVSCRYWKDFFDEIFAIS